MNTTRRLPVETQLALLLTSGFMAAMAAALLLIYVLRGSEPAQAQVWLAAGFVVVMTIAMIATTFASSRLVLRRMKQDIDARVMALMREQSATAEQLREAATQEERNRLARDLHDTIKQQLFGINVAAATAQSLSDTAAIRQQVQQVRELSQAAMVEMKALLSQLRPRPLDTAGLRNAIEEQLDALKFRAEVTTEFHAGDLPDEAQLPAGAHAALFRVVQEALSNIARHARASHVSVCFARMTRGAHDALHLTITDDGQGFDMAAAKSAKAGMGLGNMRARIAELGGTLQVQSAIGNGTTVTAELPLITARALREQAMREKEDRFQLVYWASGATSLLSMLGIAGIIALVAMAIEIASGNAQMWAAFVLTLALVTAFVMGLLFACVSLRRRVAALGNADSIWRVLLQHYDLTQGVSLAGLLAWMAFTFRLSGVAAVFAAAAIAMAVFVARNQRTIDARIEEWATLRGLRNRMSEMRALLLFGVVMIALTLAGAFGDLSRVALFHQRFDMAWMTSFIVVIYPVILASSALAMVGLRRQMALLHAMAPADEELTPDVELRAPDAVQQQRWLARGLTLLLVLAAALIGAGIGMASGALAGASLVVCIAAWLAKARVESALTLRVNAWSTLSKQRLARTTYLYFMVIALVMIAGGMIGGVVGYTAAPSAPASSTRSLPQLFGLLTAVVASPAYFGMMLAHASRRVRNLESQEKETAKA